MRYSMLTLHRQSLGHSPVFLLLVPLLFTQKGEQWRKKRNRAVALAMLSLNFNGKASGGIAREISWDAGLHSRRHIWSRQVDPRVTSLETVIEVSCGFKYCEMWSKNLSLSLSSMCDTLEQMSPPILPLFSSLYVSVCIAWSPSPHCTSLVLPTPLLQSSLSPPPCPDQVRPHLYSPSTSDKFLSRNSWLQASKKQFPGTGLLL